MSEEIEAPEGGEVDAPDAAAVEAAAAESHAIEEKASRMGWRPKDQFKGDPEKWTDAKSYVERGEQLMPLLQANNRKLEQANEKLNGEVAEMRKTLKEFGEYHSKTAQREYERALRDLETRQEAAVEANDVAGVKAITKEIAELSAEVAKPTAAAEDPKNGDDDWSIPKTWLEANAWYETDEVMTDAAYGIAARLAKQGMPKDKQLEAVADQIRKAFPQKFENPRRREPAAVEGGGAQRGKGTKGWADLPPEAKAAGERFERQKLLTKDQYAKQYWANA